MLPLPPRSTLFPYTTLFRSGGALAAKGTCHDDVVQQLLTNNYFGMPPPKSLDRNDFSSTPIEGLSLEDGARSEEHTSELQSQSNLVCRLLLEKKKKKQALAL